MNDEMQKNIAGTELSPHGALPVKAPDLLSVIAQVVQEDKELDVAKMKELLAMYKEVTADNARVAFSAAMARLQAILPQISKYGKGKNSKFAKLEDIDVVIKPLLREEGFSMSFDEESHTEKTVTFLLKVSHEKGHSETKRLTVPIDAAAKNQQGNAVRPAIQDAGSTVSYARRYLIKMFFNIVEQGEDTDGEKRDPISEDQCRDAEVIISELNMDKRKFMLYMGVGEISEILARDWKKALNAFETKREENARKAATKQ